MRPSSADRRGRRRHFRQQRALVRIPRHPAALHQHGAALRQNERRDDEEARPPLHLPVVEKHGVLRAPGAFQAHAPMVLGRRVCGREGEIGGCDRRHLAAAGDGIAQRDLLRRAVELPGAQAGRDGSAEHGRDGGHDESLPRARRCRCRQVRPARGAQCALMSWIIAVALLGILAALATAGLFMLRRGRDDGRGPAATSAWHAHWRRAWRCRWPCSSSSCSPTGWDGSRPPGCPSGVSRASRCGRGCAQASRARWLRTSRPPRTGRATPRPRSASTTRRLRTRSGASP